jgi:hypothetical protein
MSVAATLPGGEAASAESWDGAVLVLASPRAFAPGAPVRVALGTLGFEGKSLGSKKRDDGRFVVRLRAVNLRREQREALDALFPRPA